MESVVSPATTRIRGRRRAPGPDGADGRIAGAWSCGPMTLDGTPWYRRSQ